MFAPALRICSHGLRDTAEILLIWAVKNINIVKNKECGMRYCHTILKKTSFPKAYTHFGKYRIHLSYINNSAKCLNSSNSLYTDENRSTLDVEEFLKKHSITIKGSNPATPFLNIEDGNFSDDIVSVLRNSGIDEPTPIQSLAWANALQGRDYVGISKTGSGKTLAFIIPALIHIQKQKRKEGEKSSKGSPLALVVVPTRELALQVESVAEMFLGGSLRCVSLYGGASRHLQLKQIQKGVDLCIATTGRLLDFLNAEVLSLRRCSFLVLDEADRMLDMGFLPDIEEIINAIRCKRQTLMWSATWPKEVRNIAQQFLSDYIMTAVGSTELEPNVNIRQFVNVVSDEEKRQKLIDLIYNIRSAEKTPKILIFVQTKFGVENLHIFLESNGIHAPSIHSGKTQSMRVKIMDSFRGGITTVLIATAVAARGLDIDNITHVINYDCPQTLEEYIHKIGRTGRHDKSGIAYTFVTPKESYCKYLISILRKRGEEIPEELYSVVSDRSLSFDRMDRRRREYYLRRPSGFKRY